MTAKARCLWQRDTTGVGDTGWRQCADSRRETHSYSARRQSRRWRRRAWRSRKRIIARASARTAVRASSWHQTTRCHQRLLLRFSRAQSSLTGQPRASCARRRRSLVLAILESNTALISSAQAGAQRWRLAVCSFAAARRVTALWRRSRGTGARNHRRTAARRSRPAGALAGSGVLVADAKRSFLALA